MIVLHASWISGRPWLWAEAAPEESTPGPPGPGPPRASSRPSTAVPAVEGWDDPALPYALPFGAAPDQLVEALERAPGGFFADPERLVPLVGWFPVRGRRPIPSTPLVSEPPRGPGRIRLRPWTVAGLPLELEEALTLLATVRDRRTLGAGLLVSPDLTFWAQATIFAARLVAGGHVLPGLVQEDGVWMARWTPVLKGGDLESLARLTRRMPPVARAMVDPWDEDDERREAAPPTLEAPPDPSPLELTRDFVTRMADHLVRSAQWPDHLLPHPAEVRGPNPNGDHAGKSRRRPARRGNGDSSTVDERWLEALRMPDPIVEGEARELVDLAHRLEEWRRPLTRLLGAPWSLTFLLEEPAEGRQEPWHLRFLLQDVEDPSLMLPLALAWGANGGEAKAFFRGRARPREHLLQALGQAARLSPVVEEGLGDTAPSEIALDGAAAHQFLREEAPLLREAGFGVRLPAWWTRDRSRLRPSVRGQVDAPAFQASSGLDLNALASVHWEVVLGGEAMSAEELRALARLKAPLVRFRGEWVEVDAEELRRAIMELARIKGEGIPAARLARMALGAEEGPAGLHVEEIRADGPLGELLDGLQGEARFRTLEPPEGLRGELRPYQERGYSWLGFLSRWGLGACLADDMGLGKTIQTLALVQRDREEDGDSRPVLVVCPTSVVTNWEREAARFTPALQVRVHHGPDRPAGEALADSAGEADVLITTYALLHRDAEDLARVPWRGLVLDEAQNIKNPDTRRARAARSLPADFRVALTGTPVENHVGDLWSIMELLNPGLLGSRASFRKHFFLPIQTARDPDATARLRRITGPFILRRLKTDRTIIQDLPERIESRAFCTLTREQASLYAAVLDALEEGLAEGAEGIQRKGLVLATLTRLKQVCNHPAHFLGDGSPVPGRSGKVERLAELLHEMRDGGGRALIFTQYTRMGEILKGHLQEVFGREVPFLHGSVSRSRREEMVDRFQDPAGPEVFLLSLKAGGTGLNLTAANHVFLFDRWWNPAVESQATDRAFRIGQHRNVQVHKFICRGTLEEQIDRIVEGKKEVARAVVGAGEGWLTELSNEELRDVLALRPDAAADENGDHAGGG